MYVQINEAISCRLSELLEQRKMTQYRLFIRSGVPKTTISSILHRTHQSVQLRVLHELCQGLDISLEEFFRSPLFDEENLDP